MTSDNFNDGDQLSVQIFKDLQKKGFNIDSKDFTNELLLEKDGSSDNKVRLNFVGFTTNKNGDIMTVYPKKYNWEDNTDIDRRKIFRAINKHIQKRPSMYIGSEFEKNISTNFPFSAFFSIYEYFEKYGIHFEQQHLLKPDGTGKVNWKETIRLSRKFIVDGKLIMLPIYYNETKRIDTFLANCMIFAIDFTINKFNAFIEQDKTNRPFPEFNFLLHKEFVIDNLYSIRNRTYRDRTIKLIDDLIKFFSIAESSGNYFLKHYSFHSVWEDMVMIYLKSYFLKFDNKKMVLSDIRLEIQKKFSKPAFHPNFADQKKSIQPDHYLEEGDTQIILDAKYYEPLDMDYKQISYLFFLKNRRDQVADPPKFSKTHSALIIPYNERNSRLHFEMNPLYNKEFADIVISEERLNINEVINFWIKN